MKKVKNDAVLNVKIPRTLKRQCEQRAKADRRGLSDWVRLGLEKLVNHGEGSRQQVGQG